MSSSQKIVFFDVKDWEIEDIKNKLKDMDVRFSTESLSKANASEYANANIISVFINSKLTSEILEHFKDLKLISTRSTGYDHIDLAYCKDREISVANVPSYGANTVAEHTFALILCLTRRVIESVDRVRAGKFYPTGLTGIDLLGKTIGVIGTGNIGSNVIKYSKAFGMDVLAFDLKPNLELSQKLGFQYVTLEHMLPLCDIITLHLPLTDSTRHVINRSNISLLKKSAIVINTARGGLIETDALFDALKSKQISGAGLDVLEEESFLSEELELLHNDKLDGTDLKIAIENHVMAHLPNVIITPHNAFNSKEALNRILETALNNIVSYTSGILINLV